MTNLNFTDTGCTPAHKNSCLVSTEGYSITTVTKVPVKAGGSVSVPCLYGPQYRNYVKYLCVGYYWNHCTYAARTDQPQSSGKSVISDDREQTTFKMTMTQLTKNDTDYWCVVEINHGPDVGKYFHLSITSKFSFPCISNPLGNLNGTISGL